MIRGTIQKERVSTIKK